MSVGIGLVGIGHVAKAQIAAMADTPGVIFVAAHDRDDSKRALLPDTVHYCSTLDELIRWEGVDVLLVSVPNKSHYEIAKALVGRGAACMVEKPVSENSDEFDDLVAYARRREVFLSVALHASHALDVCWWQEHASEHDFGPITGFECSFFDPYIENGVLLDKANGLGGAWRDSAINALSVIGLFICPDTLRLIDARMTCLPGLGCSEVQGSALFRFPLDTGETGTGLIDTNWTLARNQKSTRLVYARSGHEVVLDHSAQTVTVLAGDRQIEVKALATDTPRLVMHYRGVFSELAQHFRRSQRDRLGNLVYAAQIHRVYHSALEYRT